MAQYMYTLWNAVCGEFTKEVFTRDVFRPDPPRSQCDRKPVDILN